MTNMVKLIGVTLLFFTVAGNLPIFVLSESCKSTSNVYGENEIIDQLMVCALSKSSDLDLTPQGDNTKNTPKTLVDQGFSNKTSILYAKLSGLWSAKRSDLVQTSWSCDSNKTIASVVIQVDGLALDVIERVEIPLHRSQHKLAVHKPCKTFDLPLWLCRQSKPMYKTTKTWVNRAYFNLTLAQAPNSGRPKIDKLEMMFTCPETFNQKITHSPSAMYILAKYMQNLDRKIHQRDAQEYGAPNGMVEASVGHPVSYVSAQSGKSPASPPYHSSVNLIGEQATAKLHSSLDSCIESLDMDLALVTEHQSFTQDHYIGMDLNENDSQTGVSDESTLNECSNKRWIMNRIELAADAARWAEIEREAQLQNVKPSKRSQFMNSYPQDPNQLLNPYGYYLKNANEMIDRR